MSGDFQASNATELSRRRILKYAGAGSLTTLAGCSGGGDGGDGGGGGGSGDGGNGGGQQTEQIGDEDGESIVIGSPLPLTGAFAPSGEDNRDAIRMAVEDFFAGRENIEGSPEYVPEGQPEVLGDVELLFQDTELDAEVGTRAMRQMIEQDGADYIVGGVSTSVTVGLSELARDLETLTVLTGTGNTQVTGEGRGKWHFRTYLSAYNTSRTLTNQLVNEEGYENFFTVYSDYGWGHDHRDVTREVVEGGGGQVVNEVAVPFGTSDFSGEITQVQNSNADLAYFAVFDNDAINAIKQVHQAGLKEDMDIAIPIHTVPQSRGLTQDEMSGIWGTLKYYFTYDNPNNVNFVNRFYDRYGRIPSSEGTAGYKSAMEVLKAVERAGTVDDRDVIGELEGNETVYFKDAPEYYRECDHQMIQPQTVGRGYRENPDIGSDFPSVDFPLVEEVQRFTEADGIFRDCEDLGGSMDW